MMDNFPVRFVELIESKLDAESGDFFKSIALSPRTSIRLNLEKLSDYKLGSDFRVPWCSHAFYLEERPVFALDPLFHGGVYYVQESSSMYLDHVIKHLRPHFNDGIKVLDLCAAPGGKSTLLLDALKENDILVANETIRSRAQILKENILKWGRSNCIVTNMDPSEFNKSKIEFDIIVIDAPCSGEGMFRKDKNAITEWSIDNVNLCSARQQRILNDILPSLKPGGFIVYSTCTFNDQENIHNVFTFCKDHQLISLPMHNDLSWGILPVKKQEVIGYHFFPHKVQGEGFFCAVLQKEGEHTPSHDSYQNRSKLKSLEKSQRELVSKFIKQENLQNLLVHDNGDVYYYTDEIYEMMHTVMNDYRVVYSGTKCGNINKNLFIPDHALALSNLVNPSIPTLDLDLEDALKYLRRNLDSINSSTKSWTIAKYKGIHLGWLKNLGNRINNYLPQEYRLRMQ